MKRLTVVSLILLILTASFAPFAFGATSGTSGGTVNIANVSPVIGSVTSSFTSGTQINVAATYTVTVPVTEDNSMEDITSVTFVIWDDASANVGDGDDVENHYTFVYTQSGDTWTETGPDSSPPNDHLIEGSCTDPSTLTDGTGSYVLGFMLDEEATKTASATWDVKVTVLDDDSNTDTDQSKTFGVNLYREISIVDASHSWAGLSPGDSDQALDSPVDGDIDITVTCNAAFDIQIKSGGNPTSGSYSFAVANIEHHEATLGSAIAMTTSYADIPGLTSETAGAGISKAFKLWVSIPGVQQDGAYTYTLTVQVIEA